MKKKELKEKSVLEGLTILLEKQNMLVFQSQPENNTIKMVCGEVPERIGLHYWEEPSTGTQEREISGRVHKTCR